MALRTENGKLFLDFYCYTPDGRKIRCREWTGLKDIVKNRKILQAKDMAIRYELRHGSFDYLHFFPNGSRARFFRSSSMENDLIFADWWDTWISEKSLRPNTSKGWNSVYRIHLGPAFGHYRLSEITDHEILVYRKLLVDRGLSPSSINDKIIKVLCMALYRACRRGLVSEYPCQNIKRLQESPIDINPFSFDELRYLLDIGRRKAPVEYPMLLFWSRTGLRPGELCALKWARIDLYNRKALIRETRLPSGSVGPPKTRHSIRDVDLRPAALEALKLQEPRTRLMDSYIFMTSKKRPYSDAYLRKRFRHILNLAGLAYRPPKQMRHTFATLSLAAGESITWVSRMLGHSNGQITWKRYNRYIPNLTRDDGSALDRMLEKTDLGSFKAVEIVTDR